MKIEEIIGKRINGHDIKGGLVLYTYAKYGDMHSIIYYNPSTNNTLPANIYLNSVTVLPDDPIISEKAELCLMKNIRNALSHNLSSNIVGWTGGSFGCLEGGANIVRSSILRRNQVSLNNQVKLSFQGPAGNMQGASDALDAIVCPAFISLCSNMFDTPACTLTDSETVIGTSYTGSSITFNRLTTKLLHHSLITHITVDLTRRVIAFGRNGLMKFWEYDKDQLIDMIKNNDVAEARNLLLGNEDVFMKLLEATYGANNSRVRFAFNTIINGADTTIKPNKNTITNWQYNFINGVNKRLWS